jgi:hypothetical protein
MQFEWLILRLYHCFEWGGVGGGFNPSGFLSLHQPCYTFSQQFSLLRTKIKISLIWKYTNSLLWNINQLLTCNDAFCWKLCEKSSNYFQFWLKYVFLSNVSRKYYQCISKRRSRSAFKAEMYSTRVKCLALSSFKGEGALVLASKDNKMANH